jgi:hypothetical protein
LFDFFENSVIITINLSFDGAKSAENVTFQLEIRLFSYLIFKKNFLPDIDIWKK